MGSKRSPLCTDPMNYEDRMGTTHVEAGLKVRYLWDEILRIHDTACLSIYVIEVARGRFDGFRNKVKFLILHSLTNCDLPKSLMGRIRRGQIMLKFRFFLSMSILIVISLPFGEIAGASSWLFSKIPQSEVNAGYVGKSNQLMDGLYAKWQNGTFEPLGDEFTPEMQKALTPELQKQSFEQIRSMFGDYHGMTFVEALTARFLLPRGTVYRYKGTYSRTSEQPEIRVVFDSDGKISGLWLKPWREDMQ
jgi:hypothetical protein